jgi:vanillate O-demethylase monooxygenase subunit
MGDPQKADENLIPDTFSLQHPAWRTKPGYKRFGANVLLLTDNLLDFSHLSYVHEKTFGGATDIAEAPQTVNGSDKQALRIVRKARNTCPAPFHRKLGSFTGNVNRWWEYTLSISGVFIMTAGAQSVDKAEGDLEGALIFHSCAGLTPETKDSTHYFFSHAHNFSLDDPAVTDAVYQSVVEGFDEDRRMIEAQAQVVQRDPSRELVGIQSDGPIIRYRRLVAAALAAEAKA